MLSGSRLQSARARVEGLMDSRVRIRRRSAEVRNSATGRIERTWQTVYEGPARIRFRDAQPRGIDAAGQRLSEQSPTVSLPVGADARILLGSSGLVRVDDEGEVLENPDDTSRVGSKFRIAGEHGQTHSTARRLPVEVYSHG